MNPSEFNGNTAADDRPDTPEDGEDQEEVEEEEFSAVSDADHDDDDDAPLSRSHNSSRHKKNRKITDGSDLALDINSLNLHKGEYLVSSGGEEEEDSDSDFDISHGASVETWGVWQTWRFRCVL